MAPAKLAVPWPGAPTAIKASGSPSGSLSLASTSMAIGASAAVATASFAASGAWARAGTGSAERHNAANSLVTVILLAGRPPCRKRPPETRKRARERLGAGGGGRVAVESRQQPGLRVRPVALGGGQRN